MRNLILAGVLLVATTGVGNAAGPTVLPSFRSGYLGGAYTGQTYHPYYGYTPYAYIPGTTGALTYQPYNGYTYTPYSYGLNPPYYGGYSPYVSPYPAYGYSPYPYYGGFTPLPGLYGY